VPDPSLDKHGQVEATAHRLGTRQPHDFLVAILVPEVDIGFAGNYEHDLGLSLFLVRVGTTLGDPTDAVHARERLWKADLQRELRGFQNGVVRVDGETQDGGSSAEEQPFNSCQGGSLLGHDQPHVIFDTFMASAKLSSQIRIGQEKKRPHRSVERWGVLKL